MGRLFLTYAEKEDSVYVCRCCFTHLSTSEQIISKVSGPTKARAYLHAVCIHCGVSQGKGGKVDYRTPTQSGASPFFFLVYP